MKNRLLKIILFSLVLFIGVSSFTYAIDDNTIAPLKNDLHAPITSISGIASVLINIIKWIYTFIFIFAVLFILIASYNFVTGGGNDEKIKKAKHQLTYAIVGIVIALLSYAIVAVVKSLITGNSGAMLEDTLGINLITGFIA